LAIALGAIEQQPLKPMSTACELPLKNATPEEIRRLLQAARTIAIVGLSDKPERDSYHVARYLKAHGYRIIPVNPNVAEVHGERAVASLRDVPGPVDIVDIFRKPEAVPAVVEDAIAIGAKAVWMQEGIAHNAAADRARAAGLQVVMNKCIMKEHRNAFGNAS
jgi:predicted CoA-binding protein